MVRREGKSMQQGSHLRRYLRGRGLTRAYTRPFTRNESIKHNLYFSARPQLQRRITLKMGSVPIFSSSLSRLQKAAIANATHMLAIRDMGFPP